MIVAPVARTSSALEDIKELAGWRIYLCGNPDMVKSLRKRCYLAGAAMKDIYIDPYELTELRKVPRDTRCAKI